LFGSLIYEMIWNAHSLTSCIVLLILSGWIYREWSTKLINPLIQLGALSFGIFLFHPFINLVFRRYFNSHEPLYYHIWVAVTFLCALCLSWITVHFVGKHFKGHWILFGSIPQKLPYKISMKAKKDCSM
jgi:peptidoglycan/LPS O-acetylase OafA/YrhL